MSTLGILWYIFHLAPFTSQNIFQLILTKLNILIFYSEDLLRAILWEGWSLIQMNTNAVLHICPIHHFHILQRGAIPREGQRMWVSLQISPFERCSQKKNSFDTSENIPMKMASDFDFDFVKSSLSHFWGPSSGWECFHIEASGPPKLDALLSGSCIPEKVVL